MFYTFKYRYKITLLLVIFVSVIFQNINTYFVNIMVKHQFKITNNLSINYIFLCFQHLKMYVTNNRICDYVIYINCFFRQLVQYLVNYLLILF